MERNLKVKGNGVIARWGQKEAGREEWTERTGSGYKAGGWLRRQWTLTANISSGSPTVNPIRTARKPHVLS